MKGFLGLLWALGGAVIGFVLGAIVAIAISKATNASNREGAQGYFMIALGLIGAIGGIIAGLALYGRSAPAGQGLAYTGSGALGLVALIAGIAVSLWAFMQLREAPLMYGGAQASLEMELRIPTARIPAEPSRWLNLEVHTAKTRPVGTISWSSKRTEGEYTIVPVIQGPLYRSGSRIIVVAIEGEQVEAFMPPMKRTPNPKADWSEWYRPTSVDPPYGVVPKEALKSIIELRYRVSVYGQERP